MIIYSNKNIKILDVTVNDNSYRYRVIKGDHNITLYYSLAEHVEIPVGSFCVHQGERYTLERPEAFKMKHSRNFEYTVTLESYQAKSKIWKFRNPVDGRLKFPLTAKPREHLQMFVDNMNRRDYGWEAGECIDGVETLVNYNHVFCWDALGLMATEFEFVGKTVHLRKVEYNKNNPLPLSYGRGNGFKPGVGRSNYGDTPPIEILYVQGGSDNIDASKYGSAELLLPKNQGIRFDGVYFEGDPNFNPATARAYVTDDLGYSIRRGDKELASLAEDSIDCSGMYPKRAGKISSVVVADAANNFYDIVDDTIPQDLNYEDCLIEGETMTVIFQSGMLAGREFEVKYCHDSVKGKAARRFEIVPAEIDGQTMPNSTFAPKAGDAYAVFKCMLPDAYVCDNDTKSGASWDMFRAGVKYLFDNEEQKFSFSGELDGIWAKKDWLNIGGKIKLGGYILFSDDNFQKEGVLVRITGIKEYINKPHSPEIELSNSTVGGSFSTTLKRLESEEVLVDSCHRDSIQFTKRRFRDAKETMGMLDAAWQENFSHFSGSISPLAVQTMMLLVGDESLQFRFVDSRTAPHAVNHGFAYDAARKQFMTGGGIIQHMTLGIDTLCPEHDASEYKFWDMEPYESPVLDDPSKGYYLYARCSKTAGTGSFMLSEQAVAMDGDTGWHLLAGILNSEYEGERSFVTLYGFTEILPGRITADKIVSTDGNTYFDLLKGVISGRITFEPGSSGLHNLDEWDELDGRIDAAQNDADAAAESAKDANDAVGDLNEYVDGAFSDGVISEAEAKAIEKYVNTVNNTKAAMEAAYGKLYTNAYLSGTAKTGLLNAKVTLMGSIDGLISAINSAIADGKATAAEKDDVDSKYSTFNSAYADFEAAVEVANKAIQDALKGYADEAARQAIEAGAKADAAQRAADSAAEAARDLKSDVEGAFRDGIITETERRRLENDINVVNTTLEKVKATYNEFHGNDYLAGAARTGLETAYNSFIAAAGTLTESIRAAIADDKATDEESKTVNANYDAFNKAYAAFEAAVEVANKAIQDALKGYAEAAKNELATKLGYESYDAMVEAAEAGKTMVVGGHINTDLIEVDTLLAGKTFTKEMLAEWVKVEKLEAGDLTVTGSSKIAGFTVSGNGLHNAPFDNDAYVIFRNDEHGCFAGIGGNVLPSVTGARGVARFENFDGGDWFNSVDGTNYAVVAGARGARDNVALAVTGGCVAGLALKTLVVGWDESAGTGSKSAAIGRDVGCVLASMEYTYITEEGKREKRTRDIFLALPDMELYDDGHTVKIKRAPNAGSKVYIAPGKSKWTDYSDPYKPAEKSGKACILYDRASYAYGQTAILDADGAASEFVYFRDLATTNGTAEYHGCWVQFKHPRDW